MNFMKLWYTAASYICLLLGMMSIVFGELVLALYQDIRLVVVGLFGILCYVALRMVAKDEG